MRFRGGGIRGFDDRIFPRSNRPDCSPYPGLLKPWDDSGGGRNKAVVLGRIMPLADTPLERQQHRSRHRQCVTRVRPAEARYETDHSVPPQL
jgi:hypothetical protein